jgi:hypothetical protein
VSTDEPVVVVLPEIAPDQAAGFVQRARVDAQRTRGLEQQHLVTLRDCGVLHEGLAWFVIRRVAGTSLLRHVKARGALGTDVALHLFERLTEQVGAAHARGVCLGDLRPANIILVGQDEPGGDAQGVIPEIVDMGFARGVFDGLIELPEPPAAYRAPQRRNGDALTPADDVYALGAVLYFMLTARSPQSEEGEGERPERMVAPPSYARPDLELSVYVDKVVLRALAPHTQDRYASTGELLEAVRGLRELFKLSPAAREVLRLKAEDQESRVDAFESDPTAEFGPRDLMPRLFAQRQREAPAPATIPVAPERPQEQPTYPFEPPRYEGWPPPPPPGGWQAWPPPEWIAAARAGAWPPPGSVPPGYWPPGAPAPVSTGQFPALPPPMGPHPTPATGQHPALPGPHGMPTGQYPAQPPYPPAGWGPPPPAPQPDNWGRRPPVVEPAPPPPVEPAPPWPTARPTDTLGIAPLRLEAEPGQIAPAPEARGRRTAATAGRWIASLVLVLLVFGGVIAVAWTLQGGEPPADPGRAPVPPPAAEQPSQVPQAPRPAVVPAREQAPAAAPPSSGAAGETAPDEGEVAPPGAPIETGTPPRARAPGSAAAEAAPVGGLVHLDITTTPPGARVIRVKTGDVRCEATPCVVEHEALPAGKTILLRLEKAGYQPRDVYLSIASDGQFAFDLTPGPASPPAVAASAPASVAAPASADAPPSTEPASAAPDLRDPFGE